MRIGAGVRVAYAVAVALLIASAAGFRAGVSALDLYLRKEPVPMRRALSTIPSQLGRWKQVGPDGTFSAEVIESLGTQQYLDRSYAIDGDPSKGVLTLHVAYYTGMIDAVPHVPERCWGAAGMVMAEQPRTQALPVDASSWSASDGPAARDGTRYAAVPVSDPVTRRPETVHMPIGAYEASVTEFQDRREPTRRQVGGYFFVANGRITPSAYVVRSYAFDLGNRYAYYCKVQVSGNFPEKGAGSAWTAQAGDLLTHAMPHIMRCLPDWPAWESAPAQPSVDKPIP